MFRWDNSRFAVVQYSDDPRTEFLMNDHLSIQEVLNAIDAIPYKGTFQISAFAKKSNAHYPHEITPKRVTSLRSISPRPCAFWDRNFEE